MASYNTDHTSQTAVECQPSVFAFSPPAASTPTLFVFALARAVPHSVRPSVLVMLHAAVATLAPVAAAATVAVAAKFVGGWGESSAKAHSKQRGGQFLMSKY